MHALFKMPAADPTLCYEVPYCTLPAAYDEKIGSLEAKHCRATNESFENILLTHIVDEKQRLTFTKVVFPEHTSGCLIIIV